MPSAFNYNALAVLAIIAKKQANQFPVAYGVWFRNTLDEVVSNGNIAGVVEISSREEFRKGMPKFPAVSMLDYDGSPDPKDIWESEKQDRLIRAQAVLSTVQNIRRLGDEDFKGLVKALTDGEFKIPAKYKQFAVVSWRPSTHELSLLNAAQKAAREMI